MRVEVAYDALGQLTRGVKFNADGATNLNGTFLYTSDGIGNVTGSQASAEGGGEAFSYTLNRQNQLTAVPHSGTTPILGRVHPNATLTVEAAVSYATALARQTNQFQVRLSTGTTNVDRYVSLTNIAVLNNGTNADIVTTNALARFLPATDGELRELRQLARIFPHSRQLASTFQHCFPNLVPTVVELVGSG